ncbi:hypothetical protein HBA91_16885 [Ochrobactrum sp. MR34]|nr:hypothetical protein [Ochrobactrum sp. MR34]
MNFIKMSLSIAVMVVIAGCANSKQENIKFSADECLLVKNGDSFYSKCEEPKPGWKGANGNGLIFSQ